jgi:hypothetical protein
MSSSRLDKIIARLDINDDDIIDGGSLVGGSLVGGAFSGGCMNCPCAQRALQGAGMQRHCVEYKTGAKGKRRCSQFAENKQKGYEPPMYLEDYTGRKRFHQGSRKNQEAAARNPWLDFLRRYRDAVNSTPGAKYSTAEASRLYHGEKPVSIAPPKQKRVPALRVPARTF